MMDKYVGKRLDGRYEIKEIIGIGGMAVVYKAYDSIDDRTVAVKILKEELLQNEEFRRRFKNESKAIAVMSHPNIVKVYDVSFGDRLQYIVMEYIDGITLKEYIERQKIIRWKDALYFTIQVLRALQHAHDKGIIHRDIKPQNIMLLQDGTIKVTDFGIARFSRSEHRTLTDKAIGSVHYISPEQARGEITDEKSDLYSVGVLLYEMLTGRLPFDAESAVSVAIMQLQNDPIKPRSINSSIPEGLEEITLRAMQKNPAARYHSAAEMLMDIEKFKANPSIQFEYKYFVDEDPTKFVSTKDGVGNLPSGDDIPKTKRGLKEESAASRSPVIPILLGVTVAFVAGLIILGIWAAGSMFGIGPCAQDSSTELECPNLIGLVYNDVIADAKYKDYTFTAESGYNSEYAAGVIFDQTPDAGKTIKGKHEVVVKVSMGAKRQTIEHDYSTGAYSLSIVKEELTVSGFKYEVIESYNDTVANGFVINTSPAAGESINEGDTVKIYVSKGPAPNNVTVSDYTKLTEADAKRLIEANGLTVGKVSYAVSSDYSKGIVIGQTPSKGTTVNSGTVVYITVSSGRKVNLNVPVPDNAVKKFVITAYYDGREIYNSGSLDPTTLNSRSVSVSLDPSKLSSESSDSSNPSTAKSVDTASITIKYSDENYIKYTVNFTDGSSTENERSKLSNSVLFDEVSSPPPAESTQSNVSTPAPY